MYITSSKHWQLKSFKFWNPKTPPDKMYFSMSTLQYTHCALTACLSPGLIQATNNQKTRRKQGEMYLIRPRSSITNVLMLDRSTGSEPIIG